MRSSIVAMALALTLVVSVITYAQAPGGSGFAFGRGQTSASASPNAPAFGVPPAANTAPNARSQTAPRDPKVFPADSVLPAPASPSEIEAPTTPLPTEPIEPYLLTKDAGPFMVMAHTFRGPDAARYALALALELRRQHELPAWVYYQKVQPMHSNIRDVPPTAPEYVRRPELALPEKMRIYDEAAVLVGNCRTLEESEKLLHSVKKIHPKCLDGMPSLWPWRQGIGLSRAMRCTNPYIPAQVLYPRKVDPLVKQMNSGPMSLFNCPGRYTLQVAQFTGRSSMDAKDVRTVSEFSLKTSPLMSAADNAQKIADALARDPEVMRTGFKPYVYHDRTSSKVTLGVFNAPNDPSAASLRQMLMKPDLQTRISNKAGYLLAPADKLLDLQQELPPH